MRLYRADVSEQDLLSAFDNAPVGMAVLTPSGVITACKAAMGRLLDRAPTELVGGTFFDVTHPDDLEEARRKCALMQVEGAGIVRHECRFVLPGGRIIWVSVSTSRVHETLDRPAHLIMHIGHAVGDAVLTQLAARIVALLRVGYEGKRRRPLRGRRSGRPW